MSAGSGQLDVLRVPGTEVPPFLSLGAALCSRLPQEGWDQKMGNLGCFHLTVVFFWRHTGQALECLYLPPAGASWELAGEGDSSTQTVPQRQHTP